MNTISAQRFLKVSAALGEGPLWDGESIWFVDIMGKCISRVSMSPEQKAGAYETFPIEVMPGCMVPNEQGGFLVAAETGIYKFSPETGGLGALLKSVEMDDTLRFNDGKCDPRGRFLAGTMDTQGRRGRGALYLLDHDLKIRPLLDGVSISNGLAWSEDSRVLYYVDTPTSAVQAFSYDAENGTISEGRTACTISPDQGLPDGMTIDREGRLWIALWGGWAVGCWDPVSGEQLCRIEVPAEHVTSCCFCGPDLDILCITTAGAYQKVDEQGCAGDLFICRPGVQGYIPKEFSGSA